MLLEMWEGCALRRLRQELQGVRGLLCSCWLLWGVGRCWLWGQLCGMQIGLLRGV